jgi:AhpC/TSA antioxidant enzyme
VERIPEAALDRFVNGVNLMPGSLRDQLGERATLLVFLRHFGCAFCRETIADLRAAAAAPGYPPVLFFFRGTPMEGRVFMRRYWPEVRAVADPELFFYEAFGVDRGGLLQMFGPGVLAAGLRARRKGFGNEERSGDIYRMPGAFLVQGERVLWQHRYRHAGDHPDFRGVPSHLAAPP